MSSYMSLNTVDPEERARLMDVEQRVIAMRLEGVSFRQIERRLGITHAIRVWQRGLARTDNGDARSKYALQQEHERIDSLQKAIWDQAQAGDTDAIRTIERLMQRRAKLAGLDHADRTADKLAEIERSKLNLLGASLMQAVAEVDLPPDKREAIMKAWRAQAIQLEAGVSVEKPVPEVTDGTSLELEGSVGHSDTPELSEVKGEASVEDWDLL